MTTFEWTHEAHKPTDPLRLGSPVVATEQNDVALSLVDPGGAGETRDLGGRPAREDFETCPARCRHRQEHSGPLRQ